MFVADVIAVHVADQECVDLAEPGNVGSGDGAPDIIKQAGAVRIFEDKCPVEAAELAVLAAQGRNLYIRGRGGRRGQSHRQADKGGRQGQ